MNKRGKDYSREKLAIIHSTSFYLQRLIAESAIKDGGSPDAGKIIARIHKEGPKSLFIPSSRLTPSHRDEVLDKYEAYLSDLSEEDRPAVVEAYLQEEEAARRDGRYFSRHDSAIEELYGNDSRKALQALSQFLEYYGYKILTQRGQEGQILYFYRIEDYLVHASEMDDTRAWLGKLERGF